MQGDVFSEPVFPSGSAGLIRNDGHIGHIEPKKFERLETVLTHGEPGRRFPSIRFVSLVLLRLAALIEAVP